MPTWTLIYYIISQNRKMFSHRPSSYKEYLRDPTVQVPMRTRQNWKRKEEELIQKNLLRAGTFVNVDTAVEINEQSDENRNEETVPTDVFELPNEISAENNDDGSTISDSTYISSDDEIDGEDDVFLNMDDQLLYEGSQITKIVSHVLIMSFAIKYKLTKRAIGDLCKLIESHCPVINRCAKSVYKLKKFLSDHFYDAPAPKKYRYCSRCHRLLPQLSRRCRHRGCENSKSQEFYIMDLEFQLRKLFRGL